MALLAINGVNIKDPSSYSYSAFDLTSKSQRNNTTGKHTSELIAVKRRVDITYKILTQSEVSTIMQLIRPNINDTSIYFNLTYFDTYDATTKTGRFYIGDRVQLSNLMKSGVMYFENVAFNFIEQ